MEMAPMRRIRQAVLCAAIGVGACVAQMPGPESGSGTAALERGPLLVWMVAPGTAADKARIAGQNAEKRLDTLGGPPGYKEQTAGSFGKASSDHGQTSSTYGQAASNFGKNASDTGQNAASAGQTAGSFGTSAGDAGQASSTYGQTAGSFGQTASTFGSSLNGASLSQPTAAPASAPVVNVARNQLSGEIAMAFPGSQIRFLDVAEEELQDKLAAAEGSAKYPDVVMDKALPGWWYGNGVGVSMLGAPSFLDVTNETQNAHLWRGLNAAILMRAPHPAQARAFVVWMRDQGACGLCRVMALDQYLQEPGKIAAAALGYILQGDGLGDQGDVQAARFSPDLARGLALAPPSPDASLDGIKYRIDVMDAAANDRLAVVSLRAIASAPQAFGVLHALAILRKNDSGRWKVLQLSPNVTRSSMASGLDELKTYAGPGTAARLTAVSLAAPIDGDNRPPQPDLWWDNSGGAGLLVVEWQVHLGGWTDSRLMFVPDHDPRVQTRVSATFARMAGEYRWRVWSVGKGGALTLSPWRTLNIVR
jgi:hypothetical protein